MLSIYRLLLILPIRLMPYVDPAEWLHLHFLIIQLVEMQQMLLPYVWGHARSWVITSYQVVILE